MKKQKQYRIKYNFIVKVKILTATFLMSEQTNHNKIKTTKKFYVLLCTKHT